MRVKRQPKYIPSSIRMSDVLAWNEEEGLGFEELVGEYDPQELYGNSQDILGEELFQQLKPGNEMICIALRTFDLPYKDIAHIMGLTESQVKNIVYTIRKRIRENKQKVA